MGHVNTVDVIFYLYQMFHLFFSEEIDFLLECCETNHEGNIDYAAFLACFLDPSKEISFNMAVLVLILSIILLLNSIIVLCQAIP